MQAIGDMKDYNKLSGVLPDFFKHIKFKKNAGKCDACGQMTAYMINGRLAQPCPECNLKISDRKMFFEREISCKFDIENELDEKYKKFKFEDYGRSNIEFEKRLRQLKWWVNNFRPDWWLLLTGNQDTGKTAAKNAILRMLGEKKYTFHNITAYRMWSEWYDTMKNDGSVTFLQRKYRGRDILCIDEIGRHPASEKFNMYLFDIMDQRYNDCKSVIIITNLTINSKKDINKDSDISKYVDHRRLTEKAAIIPMTEVAI